jgi:hypothetical protein
VESSIYRLEGSGLLLRVGSRGNQVRSPTGVALQGTLALFSIHGVLGAACGERERGIVFLFFNYYYYYYYFLFILFMETKK